MKRIISILIASAVMILMGISTAQAQFRYGIRLGGMIPTGRLDDSQCKIEKRCGGFSGGLTCEYQLPTNGFAFDASVMYTRLGANLSVPTVRESTIEGLSKDFLHIPLNVKYKFWLKEFKELVAPYVYTGPDLMVKLGSDKHNALDGTRTLQPGWNVGVGFDAINFIQIQAGYRFGLTNTMKSRGKFHNDGVNISVAILFDI